MALVTRKFRDDFETWAADRVMSGEWTRAEIEDLRNMLRIDFTPGPDQLRAGLKVTIDNGIEVPAAIDDLTDRYRLWSDFFAKEICMRSQTEIWATPGSDANDAFAKGGER